MADPTVTRREHGAQPILFVRRQVTRTDLADALGQCLGAVFAHGQKAGLEFAGPPFSRFPSVGPGKLTIEAGMPIAAPTAGEGEIEAGYLHGGPVAFAVHAGPYETLGETYAAIESWMTDNGLRPAGPPWESYLTDPAEHPDPAHWRTELYWPLGE